ncbi:hypothetical protein JB92DRAFT_2990876, partial [Gautieria morchelliformis]
MESDLPLVSVLSVDNSLTPYFDMAAVVLLLYDHMLTLDLEIDLVWPAPWTLVKFLYVFTAYLGFVESGLFGFMDYTGGVAASPSICARVFKARIYLLTIGMVVAELVLFIRTWALFGRGRNMCIGLGIFWCSSVTVALVLLSISLAVVKYIPRPIPEVINCIAIKSPAPIIFVDFIILVVMESVILALTLYKARVHHYRVLSSSTFGATLYRDGVIYYIYLLAFSVINITTLAATGSSILT